MAVIAALASAADVTGGNLKRTGRSRRGGDEAIETKLQCHTVTGQPFGWIKTFGVADANWSNDLSSSPLPHIIPFASRRFLAARG
jgi:hypothetical protein